MEQRRPDSILQILMDSDFEAYYVGGCVRDLLLGRPVHDWDITTSALPQQVCACFPKTVPTGLRHGTVTVLQPDGSGEVTTYRQETGYADGRHPDQVTFVRSLKEDLARRDFTVNAMAMDLYGTVIDLFGGQEDLARGMLRAVGDPDQRFREDALRMLRCLRFSAQLEFQIEQATRAAIGRQKQGCANLSAERIRDEIEKTLLSDRPWVVEEMAEVGLLQAVAPGRPGSCSALGSLPRDRTVRWAGLLRCWPELSLPKLRLEKRLCTQAQRAALAQRPASRLEWKRYIAAWGLEQAGVTAALLGCEEEVQEVKESGECLSLRQLAVGGRDYPQLCGPALGELLRQLLDHVLEYPLDNTREILLELGRNRIVSQTKTWYDNDTKP